MQIEQHENMELNSSNIDLPTKNKKNQGQTKTKRIRKKPAPKPIIPRTLAEIDEQNGQKEPIKPKKELTLRQQQAITKKQEYALKVEKSLQDLVDLYNTEIQKLPKKISKWLIFRSEYLFNPVPYNKIKFQVKFPEKLIQSQQQPYLLSLSPYALQIWYQMMFSQLQVFNIAKNEIYNPNQHRNSVHRALFVIFKHRLLFTNTQNFLIIQKKLSQLEDKSQLYVLSVLITHTSWVSHQDVLRKTDFVVFPQSKFNYFFNCIEQLRNLLAYGATTSWKLLRRDVGRELDQQKQKIMKNIQYQHMFHQADQSCPQCGDPNSLYCGFRNQQTDVQTDQADDYGYCCQFCPFYVRTPLPTKKLDLRQSSVTFFPKTIEYGKNDFVSLPLLNRKNNLKSKVIERFGQDSYSSHYYSLDNLPIVCSTNCINFSKKTQKQILYNSKNEEFLPLQIKQSLIQGGGLGMFMTQDGKANSIVLPYIGQYAFTQSIVPCDSLYSIGWVYNGENIKQISICPQRKLNSARFINGQQNEQLCNCVAQRGIVDGKIYVIIVLTKNVTKGSQLYYNYGNGYGFQVEYRLQDRLRRAIERFRNKNPQNASRYHGKLAKSELAKLYRRFCQSKKLKISHQFPRLRLSEVISRILKQWNSMTWIEKDNLYDKYVAQNMFRQKESDDQSKFEENNEKIEKRKVPKQQPSKHLTSTRNTKSFVQQSIDQMRQRLVQCVFDVMFQIQQKQKKINNFLTNGQKIMIFEEMFDIHFRGQLLKVFQQYITSFNARHDTDHVRLILGIAKSDKTYQRRQVKYDRGFHNYLSHAYLELMRPQLFRQKQFKQPEKIDVNTQKLIITQNSVVKQRPKKNFTRIQVPVSYIQQCLMRKSLYISLKFKVTKAIGTYHPHSTVVRFKQLFQVIKGDRITYFQTFDDLFVGEVSLQKSKNSQNQTQKIQCCLCGKKIALSRKTTHQKQQHSHIYWAQWILVNFMRNCYVFTSSKRQSDQYGVLGYVILEATADFKTKVSKLKHYQQGDSQYICWKIQNGLLSVTDSNSDNSIQIKPFNFVLEENISQKDPMQEQMRRKQFIQIELSQNQDAMKMQNEKTIGINQKKREMIDKRQQKKRQKRQEKKQEKIIDQNEKISQLERERAQYKQKQTNKLIQQKNQAKILQKQRILKQQQPQAKNDKFNVMGIPERLIQRYQRKQLLQMTKILEYLDQLGVQYKSLQADDQDQLKKCMDWEVTLIFYQVPDHFGLLIKTQNKFVSFDGLYQFWPVQLNIIGSKLWQQQYDSFSCGYRVIFWANKIQKYGLVKWIQQIQCLPHKEKTIKTKRIRKNIQKKNIKKMKEEKLDQIYLSEDQ